jgi:ABC-type bacteriocin/lantibiotic exporter with double-glycine peptidase domain
MREWKWYKQETEISCSAACLKMVFAFYGVEEEEAILRKKCKTRMRGTHPINVVECARSYGFDAVLNSITMTALKRYTKRSAVIVNIQKVVDDEVYTHSVVVKNISRSNITVLDPEDGERIYSLTDFRTLWDASDNIAIIIEQRK